MVTIRKLKQPIRNRNNDFDRYSITHNGKTFRTSSLKSALSILNRLEKLDKTTRRRSKK